MKGYAGRILRANLSQRAIEIENLPDETFREYIGRKVFGAKVLSEETTPGTDPYTRSSSGDCLSKE